MFYIRIVFIKMFFLMFFLNWVFPQKNQKNEVFVFGGQLVAEAYSSIPVKSVALPREGLPLLSGEAQGLDTQVLLGDRLCILNNDIKFENEYWVKVALLDQLTYKAGTWRPKECFMQKRHFYAAPSSWRPNAVTNSLVADVFSKPSINAVKFGQLSIGTRIKVIKEVMHGWAEVLLASGVVGCMRLSDLVKDDILNRLPLDSKKNQVINAAKLFLGTPYRWGCCSGYVPLAERVSGVDCSGLFWLAYRCSGIAIPRDAHDQYLASRCVKFGKDLSKGDLIFLAKPDLLTKKTSVDHVLLYVGSDKLIEATGFQARSIKDLKDPASAQVRLVSAKDHQRIGTSLKNLYHGQLTDNGDLVFFGSFLS